MVWAFRDLKDKEVDEKIKIDTIKYYLTALSARCWVTNVVVERGLSFTGKKTLYFHTTHGTLPKCGGNDEQHKNVFGSQYHYRYDYSCAQSEEEKQLQLSMFGLKPEQVIVCGYPKNDILANVTEEQKLSACKELGIEPNKTVILYAPTYRENVDDNFFPIDFIKWESELGKDYVLLFRAHPVIAKKIQLPSTNFIIDVSSYPDNMKLMIASDILISDYSGVFFEYAILNRLMICYPYDYDEYIKTRSLYMDLRKELPSGTEDEILKMIQMSDKTEMMKKVEAFKEKYVSAYGNATRQAVDAIYKNIKE